jgi:hypothetical protein
MGKYTVRLGCGTHHGLIARSLVRSSIMRTRRGGKQVTKGVCDDRLYACYLGLHVPTRRSRHWVFGRSLGPAPGWSRDLFSPSGSLTRRSVLWFKGQRNDFNRRWLETARVATLSQQNCFEGPNRIFLGIALPPHASTGAGGLRSRPVL